MKKILFFACALLATAPLFAQNQKPTDFAQYGRYAAQNDSLEMAGASVDAVFLGNSITDIWIGSRPDFFKDHNFVDRGISGQTSIEILARMHRDVIDLHPKVVVILAGTNDIAQNMGPIKLEDTFSNIVSMCDIARYNGIKVVLCSLLPCDHYWWNDAIHPAGTIKQLNAMLQKYAAEQGIVYVDYHAAFDNGNGGLTKQFSEDGCHPTPYGYSQMEPMVMEGIRQALEKSDK